MNCVFLIGNLGRDPEIRTTTGGTEVASFSMATTERWKGKDGERQEKTEWHKVVVFGGLCAIVEKYVHKGSKISVMGKLQTRKWEDKDGNDRYTTEVVLTQYEGKLELLSDGGGNGKSRGRDDDDEDEDDDKPRKGKKAYSRSGRRQAAASDSGSDMDLDDDIPF